MKFPSVIIKPYLYFWITSALIVLIGVVDYIINGDSFSDINIHDTYFVIAQTYFAFFFALLYWIAGIIYWIFRDFKLIKSLTKIHTLISIYGVVAYWIIVPALALADNMLNDFANTTSTLIFCLAILVQPLFIVNLLITLFRERKRLYN